MIRPTFRSVLESPEKLGPKRSPFYTWPNLIESWVANINFPRKVEVLGKYSTIKSQIFSMQFHREAAFCFNFTLNPITNPCRTKSYPN